MMRRQLVLVEYGERWYGTGQVCLMRWACGVAQRGVSNDSGCGVQQAGIWSWAAC